jgi:hypothetical protein
LKRLCRFRRFEKESNFEIRISKSETNPKFKCPNAQNLRRRFVEHKGYEKSVFVIWYCFELSASIFEFSCGEEESVVYWPLLGAFLMPPVLGGLGA